MKRILFLAKLCWLLILGASASLSSGNLKLKDEDKSLYSITSEFAFDGEIPSIRHVRRTQEKLQCVGKEVMFMLDDEIFFVFVNGKKLAPHQLEKYYDIIREVIGECDPCAEVEKITMRKQTKFTLETIYQKEPPKNIMETRELKEREKADANNVVVHRLAYRIRCTGDCWFNSLLDDVRRLRRRTQSVNTDTCKDLFVSKLLASGMDAFKGICSVGVANQNPICKWKGGIPMKGQ